MRVTWADDIETALRNLGGRAHRNDICREVCSIREMAGRNLPESYEMTIQRTLQNHCLESDGFKGEERFVMEEKGTGFYRLLDYPSR